MPATDGDFILRVETLIRDAGGQSALARKSGLSIGAIQRYLKGGEPSRAALLRLAEAGGVSTNWLISGEGSDQESSRKESSAIPVFGFAECGLQGWYNEVRYRIPASLDWPDPDLFAVIASGHSMAPEGIHPGFVCIASPNTRAQRNDAIFIRRNDNTATIKLYQNEDKDWLYVTGWLDPEQPGGPQLPYTDRIRRNTITHLAPIVMVKRRV